MRPIFATCASGHLYLHDGAEAAKSIAHMGISQREQRDATRIELTEREEIVDR